MLRKLDMKMTLFAVVLAACGLFLVLGAAKPWSSGTADGFVAVDDEMRRLLEAAEAEEKQAQSPKQGEAATAAESRAAGTEHGAGQAEAAGTPQSAGEPKPQGGGSSVPSAGGPVPAAGQPAASAAAGSTPASQSPAASSAARLNLNQATAEQLDALPGIGPSRAAAIIELRRKRGGAFRSLDELLEIKGIGEKSLQKLKPLLTL